LVDCSHPASGKLAKAIRGSSSNSSAACDGMSAIITIDGRSRLGAF
jgi:hypothetical protein